MKRPLAALSPWIGPLPDYFPLFCESCRNVPNVDFYVVCQERRGGLPDNVRLVDLDLRGLARQKLGLEPCLVHPLKMCDLRPMFGVLFEEILEDHQYWGFVDLDQIFATSLSGVLERARQAKPDIINLHKKFTHGPSLFARNHPSVNRLFERSRHWSWVTLTGEHLCFDECGRKYAEICHRLGAPNCYTDTPGSFLELDPDSRIELDPLECFTTVVLRESRAGRLDVWAETVANEGLADGTNISLIEAN